MSKYWSIFKTQLLNRMAYVGDLAAQSFTIVIFMWIFMQLWRTTFNISGQRSISGMTLRDTMWYLMMAETVMLSSPRLSRNVAETVRDGSIAYLLSKPFNYLLYQLSVSMGDLASRLVFNILAGGTIVWLMVGPPPSLAGIPLALLSLSLSWLINFCINAMIGLAAFVAEEVSAFEWIYSKFLLLLGGVLIPLDFFPSWLRNLSLSLPFAYTIYGPARLLVAPTQERVFVLFAGQVAWLVVLALALSYSYRRSAARLVINGG